MFNRGSLHFLHRSQQVLTPESLVSADPVRLDEDAVHPAPCRNNSSSLREQASFHSIVHRRHHTLSEHEAIEDLSHNHVGSEGNVQPIANLHFSAVFSYHRHLLLIAIVLDHKPRCFLQFGVSLNRKYMLRPSTGRHHRKESAAGADVNDQIVFFYCLLDPPPVGLIPPSVLKHVEVIGRRKSFSYLPTLHAEPLHGIVVPSYHHHLPVVL
mmetsp:Transcript_29252/g.93983  ORF Transcript_29252/g.93983 Transcript_29252/m.93983 type:complete len:211 (-) Transcript_29252:72-704(-)